VAERSIIPLLKAANSNYTNLIFRMSISLQCHGKSTTLDTPEYNESDLGKARRQVPFVEEKDYRLVIQYHSVQQRSTAINSKI
jgi:hypothetical protein